MKNFNKGAYFKLTIFLVFLLCVVTINEQEVTASSSTVTVSYYSPNSASKPIKTQKVKKGSNPKEIETYKDGYEFNGWYLDKACNTKWDTSKGTVNKNTKLYAKLTKITKDRAVSVTPSQPIVGREINSYTTINKHTKNYYVLRSYMEVFEKNGGGTIILKKGTYTISNSIYVPSNVTIILQQGAVIKKTNVTGTSRVKPSGTIFTLINPSLGQKGNKVTSAQKLKGYNGVKNVTILGQGDSKSNANNRATIDLAGIKGAIAITAGHNQNVKIENIKFQNVNVSHFIEMDATNTATIKNNYFYNAKKNSTVTNKEAINLDTPDKNTQGFNYTWTSHDKTPNKNITIQNNKFEKLDRAIGTHKYSEGKYHQNIKVLDNTIICTREDAIRTMNWINSEISNNSISTVGWNAKAGYEQNYTRSDKTYLRGILVSGAENLKISNNRFTKVSRAIQYIPTKNKGAGSSYKTIYNKVTDYEKELLKTNIIGPTYYESIVRISPYGQNDPSVNQEFVAIKVKN